MRQKMAIFKGGNSVCRVQKCFQELSFYSERNEQLGAMRQKMAIFKEGNSVSRGTFFPTRYILWVCRIRLLTVKTRISHSGFI